MSLEQNKAIARRAIESLWNDRNPAVIDELFAENFVDHDLGLSSRQMWRDRAASSLPTLAPDTVMTVEQQIAEGDLVCNRWVSRFTHTVPFGGVPPTGQQLAVRGISIYRLEGGLIVEGWAQNDILQVAQKVATQGQPR